MCAVCGCSGDGHDNDHDNDHGHEHGHTHEGHSHPHEHEHEHEHAPKGPAEMVVLERRLLDKNDRVAENNRAWLAGREVLALNLMSSPGAGKTTLLVRALGELAGLGLPVSVIEGDQESSLDAQRIEATGTPVVQINTGTGCHLDAEMVRGAIEKQKPSFGSVLFIENVGNLVCPALFDLGESARVVLFSVTEGADKPIKYPHMFRRADMVVLTKIDLLPYVDFDEVAALAAVRAARPDAAVVRLSARTGEGMPALLGWIRERFAASRRG
jgi:hydrogenase nickel incorporation protein HypB